MSEGKPLPSTRFDISGEGGIRSMKCSARGCLIRCYNVAKQTAAHTTREYIVIKGDTLYRIAKRFNTKVRRIKQLSAISSHSIEVGRC